MSKYRKIKGSRIVISALVVIALLMSGCSISRVEPSYAPVEQRPVFTEHPPAQDTQPSSAPATNARITDHSFWWLACQGQAELPDTIAHTIQEDRELRDATDSDLTDFPEIDFRDADTDSDPVLTGYIIRSDMAQPGEVLSRVYSTKVEYVISVPILNDEFAKYLSERGESYYMIYALNSDGSMDAELMLYRDFTYVFTYSSKGNISVIPETSYFGGSTMLSSYHTSMENEADYWGINAVRVACPGYKCCSDNDLVKLLYDDNSYNRFLRGDGTEPLPDEFEVVDRLSDFTEISYNMSHTQLRILKELTAEFAARPLPDDILAKFAS